MKIAYLFPGQGCQVPGMGKDIYENYEEARKIYEIASDILKEDVAKLCFESDEDELKRTENAQKAILITSLATLAVLNKYDKKSDISVGISLGEYGALINGGYLDIQDGIKLIKKRGLYMEHEIPKEEYSMAAIIKLDSKKIEEICEKINKDGNFVVPSNYNYPEQTVISGTKESIDKAIDLAKKAGAFKVVKLNTSGPFHTSKLENAKELYIKDLQKVNFKMGNQKVIKIIDGRIYTTDDDMVNILSEHIVRPVRFDKALKTMDEENIDTYVEIGPGKTVTGFVKRYNKNANCYNLNSVKSIEEYLNI